jgi:hypothetical protein
MEVMRSSETSVHIRTIRCISQKIAKFTFSFKLSENSDINELHLLSDTCNVDRLCGLAVRVLGYRSGGPRSIPGTTRKKKKVVGLERGPLSLVSTTEELLDRKVAAPV